VVEVRPRRSRGKTTHKGGQLAGGATSRAPTKAMNRSPTRAATAATSVFTPRVLRSLLLDEIRVLRRAAEVDFPHLPSGHAKNMGRTLGVLVGQIAGLVTAAL
jgi:hypothetical protein